MELQIEPGRADQDASPLPTENMHEFPDLRVQTEFTRILRCIDWFIPDKLRDGPDRKRAEIIVGFSFALAVWGPLFAFIYYFTLHSWAGVVLSLLGTGLALQVPFALRYFKSLLLAGNFLVLNLFLLVSYISYLAGGQGAPPQAWIIALPMFAVTLVGNRSGLFWAGVGLLEMLGFYITDDIGYRIAQHMTPGQIKLLDLSVLSGLMFLILSMSMLYRLNQTRSRHLIEISQDQVTEAIARLQAIVQYAPDGILTFDTSGMIESFNPAAEKLFGFSADEVVGRPLKTIMPLPDNVPHERVRIQKLRREMDDANYRGGRIVGLRKDGAIFPLHVTVGKAHIHNRFIFTAILRDVTAQKKTEKERQQFSVLAARSHDLLGVIETCGRMVYFNPAGLRCTGIDRVEDVRNRHLQDLAPRQEGEMSWDRILSDATEFGSWEGCAKFKHSLTGQSTPVQLELVAITIPNEETTCLALIARAPTRSNNRNALCAATI